MFDFMAGPGGFVGDPGARGRTLEQIERGGRYAESL
jgi:hypothetical protein